MARNIEVLRNYFLGKDPQLKETMADNSLRLIGIEGKHFVLRTEVIARLEDLKKHVDEKDEELQEAIDELVEGLAGETLARQNGDATLDGKILQETNTRRLEDSRITTKLTDLETWKDNTDFVLDSDLEAALGNYYTKPEVNQLISVIPRFDIEVVQALPTQDISESTIYLVPSASQQARNSYDEFIYVSNTWEQIGTTAIDLSNYYTKSETNTLLNDKQDTLTPGDSISIINGVIDTAGDVITEITNYPIYIYNLNSGVYHLKYPGSGIVDVYYSNQDSFGLTNNALLYVDKSSPVDWLSWALIDGSNGFPDLVCGYCTPGTGNPGYMFRKEISLLEVNSNKVTTISSSSTNEQYPSAKAVYDYGETKMNASSVVTAFWHGTQAQYDALATHDSTTLYLIAEE